MRDICMRPRMSPMQTIVRQDLGRESNARRVFCLEQQPTAESVKCERGWEQRQDHATTNSASSQFCSSFLNTSPLCRACDNVCTRDFQGDFFG